MAQVDERKKFQFKCLAQYVNPRLTVQLWPLPWPLGLSKFTSLTHSFVKGRKDSRTNRTISWFLDMLSIPVSMSDVGLSPCSIPREQSRAITCRPLPLQRGAVDREATGELRDLTCSELLQSKLTRLLCFTEDLWTCCKLDIWQCENGSDIPALLFGSFSDYLRRQASQSGRMYFFFFSNIYLIFSGRNPPASFSALLSNRLPIPPHPHPPVFLFSFIFLRGIGIPMEIFPLSHRSSYPAIQNTTTCQKTPSAYYMISFFMQQPFNGNNNPSFLTTIHRYKV